MGAEELHQALSTASDEVAAGLYLSHPMQLTVTERLQALLKQNGNSKALVLVPNAIVANEMRALAVHALPSLAVEVVPAPLSELPVKELYVVPQT